MKFAVILIITLIASSAFAATCPKGSTMIKSCKSTPEAGDQVVASEVLDSIAICNQKGRTLFVAEKNGESDIVAAKVDMRMGGTSYTVTEGDVTFSLSVVTGTATPVKKAMFSVTFMAADIIATSTYTCKK